MAVMRENLFASRFRSKPIFHTPAPRPFARVPIAARHHHPAPARPPIAHSANHPPLHRPRIAAARKASPTHWTPISVPYNRLPLQRTPISAPGNRPPPQREPISGTKWQENSGFHHVQGTESPCGISGQGDARPVERVAPHALPPSASKSSIPHHNARGATRSTVAALVKARADPFSPARIRGPAGKVSPRYHEARLLGKLRLQHLVELHGGRVEGHAALDAGLQQVVDGAAVQGLVFLVPALGGETGHPQ